MATLSAGGVSSKRTLLRFKEVISCYFRFSDCFLCSSYPSLFSSLPSVILVMSNSLVSKLVFGTGGRFGRLSIYECQALVSFAYQNNIFSFDTGFSYSRGKSQSKLLQSLFSLEVRRSSFTFSTKIAIPTDSSSLYDRVSDLVLRNPSLNYVDTLFLWGPDSLSSLSEPVVSDLLRLKNDGLVKAIGVNTHNFALMNQLLVHSMHILDALMIDYNLLQLNRNDVVHYFHSHNTKHLWAGTALCQGFLVSDFFLWFFVVVLFLIFFEAFLILQHVVIANLQSYCADTFLELQ